MEHALRAYSLAHYGPVFCCFPGTCSHLPVLCLPACRLPNYPLLLPLGESWCRCCEGWDPAILAGCDTSHVEVIWQGHVLHLLPSIQCILAGVAVRWGLPVVRGLHSGCGQGKSLPHPGPGSVSAFEILTKMIKPLLWKVSIHNNIHNCINFQRVIDSTKLIYGPFVVWFHLPFLSYLNTALTVLWPPELLQFSLNALFSFMLPCLFIWFLLCLPFAFHHYHYNKLLYLLPS